MTPAEVFAARLKAVREARGVGRTELARRMSACAPEEVTRDVVSAIENGRRKTVTLDQVLAAAAALNVSPLTLIAPHDSETPIELGAETVRPVQLREWIRGRRPLDDGADPMAYFAQGVSPWPEAGKESRGRQALAWLQRPDQQEDTDGEW